MTKSTEGALLSTEDRLKLGDAEKRFLHAKAQSNVTGMWTIMNDPAGVELRHERDTADAVEYARTVEAELTKRHGGKKPATFAQLLALRALGEVVHLVREFDLYQRTMAQQVKQLQARVEAAESSAKLAWKGVWKEGVEAKEQEVWTHAGGMWCCITDTKTRPGSSKDWRLSVKRGAARP